MGRTVVSNEEEDDFIEAEEEDEPRPSRRARDDVEEQDEEEEEEDDEDEGQNEYEKDGFIVDDGDEDEEEEEEAARASDDERRKKKKKRKKKRETEDFELDEDDYMLLQDNNITGIHRPKPPENKFKRLKKAGRESEMDGRSGFSGKDGSGKGRTEEDVRTSLFGIEEPFEEDFVEEDQQVEEDEVAEDDMDDEMGDFIVDEEEIDVDGQVVKRKKVKRKPLRQAAGVSSSALQEAHDIFGDVDELLALRKQELERDAINSGELRGNRLEDEFEPFILAEKYMTPKDEQIKENDVPERIQLSEEITGHPIDDDANREEESVWIHNQLTGDGFLSLFGNEQVNREIEQRDIMNVLTMLHAHNFEIPFIAMYRQENCPSLLKDNDANEQANEEETPKMRWHKGAVHCPLQDSIQPLDRKWLLLQKRKVALKVYYDRRYDDVKRRIDDVTGQALNRQLYHSIIDALKDAKSEKEVEDVDAKFNLHFPPGEVEEVGQLKRPKRKSLYSICHKAGLWEVANQFGRSAEQLGHHLPLTRIPEAGELDSGKESPEDVAANFTCAMFETSQDVLQGARHMAAVEIGCEPIIKKHIRGLFCSLPEAPHSQSPQLLGRLSGIGAKGDMTTRVFKPTQGSTKLYEAAARQCGIPGRMAFFPLCTHKFANSVIAILPITSSC